MSKPNISSPKHATPIRPVGAEDSATVGRQQVRFSTGNLKSSYCNMCNATSTREEVVLNFGINQNWDQPGARPGALEVEMQHRVILSPFAAKRLSDALGQLMRDYEDRHGKLG